MPDTIPSPQCGDSARITERFWLDSTDGPVEYLKTGCLSKHWFTPWAGDGPVGAGGHSGSRPGGAAELTGPVAAGSPPSSARSFGT
jgi:hypothetical protein